MDLKNIWKKYKVEIILIVLLILSNIVYFMIPSGSILQTIFGIINALLYFSIIITIIVHLVIDLTKIVHLVDKRNKKEKKIVKED